MPYSKAYKGRLTVEDEAFQLIAERFIVRARDAKRKNILEVAFQLAGPYDGDAFSVDGVARNVSSDGRYVSEPLQVQWERHEGVDEAVVVLTQVEETPEGCEVEGNWHEYGDRYRFSGRLDQFLAQS